jgi:chromosome segregation ATPase
MVNVFSSAKKKEEIFEGEKQRSEVPQTSNQPADVLKKLKLEEAQLAEERQNLSQLKEQLENKIRDQIENRKENLEKLKTEINALKAECAELNETLQNQLFAE